jgi:hypothetical protein
MLLFPGQHSIFTCMMRDSLMLRFLKCRGKLDTPFDTRSIHLQEGDTHEVDDDTRNEREDAFPDLFGIRPQVGQFGVELIRVERVWGTFKGRNVSSVSLNICVERTHHSDECTSNSQCNDEPGDRPRPYLDPHPLDQPRDPDFILIILLLTIKKGIRVLTSGGWDR